MFWKDKNEYKCRHVGKSLNHRKNVNLSENLYNSHVKKTSIISNSHVNEYIYKIVVLRSTSYES